MGLFPIVCWDKTLKNRPYFAHKSATSLYKATNVALYSVYCIANQFCFFFEKKYIFTVSTSIAFSECTKALLCLPLVFRENLENFFEVVTVSNLHVVEQA